MSVTLKLADEDAALVARILREVEKPLRNHVSEPIDYEKWGQRVRLAASVNGSSSIAALAGAFEVAVQANAR